jgi:hypothetical protein
MLNFEKEKSIKGCVLKRRVNKKNFLFAITIIAYAPLGMKISFISTLLLF